ncbi:hypothetical protein ACFVQ0_35465 [Streptomyces sp. NPDC057900]|uniref:hypothetical protein n=1 Tax=Streptomyces sp. NPDC057900 TaxID=3346274 RepID=UPI0036E126DF
MSSHTFPDDLLTLQRSWQDTYAALAASRPESPATLRRRLHRLSVLLAVHPYWESAPGGGRSARVELRRQARRLP